MITYATVQDVSDLWRPLTADEQTKAQKIIEAVSAEIRMDAKRVGKDFDAMIAVDSDLEYIARVIVVAVVSREIVAPQTSSAGVMSQFSEGALGYTVSGTIMNPGQKIYLMKNELHRLGILRQRYGTMEVFDVNN